MLHGTFKFTLRSALTALAALSALLAAPVLAGVDTRVMTFNIRYNTLSDGSDAWSFRQAAVRNTISNFNPDLFGLQEGDVGQNQYLRNQLPQYSFFGVGKSDGDEAGAYSSVYYRTSRYERVDGGNFWLSTTPDVPGSKSWDADQTRVTTWVKLRDKQNPGLTFVIANNHWDHVSATARQQSGLLVRKKMATIAAGLPVIVIGDFNAEPTGAAVTNLLTPNADNAERWYDAYRLANPSVSPNEGTHNGFVGNTDGRRIDNAAIDAAWSVRSAQINRSTFVNALGDTAYPSDHYPVQFVLATNVPEPAPLTAVTLIGVLTSRRKR